MSKLLIDESPLQVLPRLAVAIGLNEAIVVQQVHYWLGRSTNVIDGHRWVYNTVEQWREQFPFWSVDTVRRTLANLKESGLLIGEALAENRFDKTMYYRIDYSVLRSIEDGICQSSECSPMPSSAAADASGVIAETTTEITTKNLPAVAGRRKRAAAPKSDDETALQAACRVTWAAYAGAYAERYGAAPVRNQKVNSQVKQFVQRLGFDEAHQVATHYLTVNERYVVGRMHDFSLLLSQAETYRTQWATGRTMTQARARQLDKTEANRSAADEALEIAMQRRGVIDA